MGDKEAKRLASLVVHLDHWRDMGKKTIDPGVHAYLLKEFKKGVDEYIHDKVPEYKG